MFDIDELLNDCLTAGAETEPRRAIREVLARALTRRDELADGLSPTEGGITVLYGSPALTVIHVVWAPGMQIFPHDHRMWAAIGIYVGQEDNSFFRRTGRGAQTLVESGGKVLAAGDVVVLGDDTIHAVANPTHRLTGAIHVYGGDFVHEPRSQWGPGPREERAWDMDDVNRQFNDANRVWRSSSTA